MKTIEITTAQKVIIQYELASVGNRFAAFLIDIIIWFGFLILINLIAVQVFDGGESWDLYFYFVFFVQIPVILFYTLVSEILMDGQTLGKRAIGLKVVKLNGDPAAPFDYLMRWAFRFIDIWFSAGSVAALLISASPNSQRLGGTLSGTTVIRKNSSRNFSLKDILGIKTRDSYEPQFPQVTRMSEQDMLFVKKVLDRYRRYKNQAHKKAILALASHMQETLDIEETQKNKFRFLKTLLTDYIVLTR